MAHPIPEEDLDRQYRALCADFAASLPTKMDEIDAALAKLADARGPAALAAAKDLEMAAHRLTGGGATFGYPKISQLAEPLERRARAHARTESIPGAAMAELLALADALRAAVADPGEAQV